MTIAIRIISIIYLLATFLTGCKSITSIQTAKALGASGGEAIGEIIGEASGNASAGSVIGANLGEVTGAVISNRMDKQAAEIRSEVPAASVRRVGDSIVVEFSNKILFEPDHADLFHSAEKNLERLVNVFTKYPDTYFEIHGHTDNKGAPSYNQSLSEKRAFSVAAYLEKKGILKNHLTAKGLGETLPKYKNDSAKDRMLNRRVEIIISAKGK